MLLHPPEPPSASAEPASLPTLQMRALMRLPAGFAAQMREWWCAHCGWSATRAEIEKVGGFCPRCGSAEMVSGSDESPDVGSQRQVRPPSRLDSREALRTGLPGFPRGLRGTMPRMASVLTGIPSIGLV